AGHWVCAALVLRLAGGDERDIPRLRGQVGQGHLRSSRAGFTVTGGGVADTSRGRPANRRSLCSGPGEGEVASWAPLPTVRPRFAIFAPHRPRQVIPPPRCLGLRNTGTTPVMVLRNLRKLLTPRRVEGRVRLVMREM